MSNYIYNDNFEDQGPEHINVYYTGKAKKHTPVALIVCTVLIVLAGVMVLGGGIFNYASAKIASKNTPTIEILESPAYESNQNSAKPLTNNTSESILVNVIASVKDSVVEISSASTGAGKGSGVIVGKFGTDLGEKGYYIITNAHVIQGSYTNMYIPVNVVLNDGTKYDTEVCEFDAKSDIAILKISEQSKELTVATWANEKTELLLGEQVIAIGNPLGVLGGTVTIGHLSALSREILVDGNTMNLLQIDAAVNPGNSGGGLFNTRGELIGIVNAKISDTDVEGIGFAIPHTEAYKSFLDLVQYGYVTGRPTIGADFVTDRLGNIVVYNAEDKSALKSGDIIRAVRLSGSDTFIPVTVQGLQELVNNMEIDDTFELRIQRGYKDLIIEITVYEYTN